MDTRGQPVQVGVIILFGFLIIAFALFQAVVVPQQNAEVEFQHSQAVTNDMQLLRNDIVEAGETGGTRTASVKLGTTYPPRVFAVNPSPASGSLRSVSVGTGEISLTAPGADIESICGYDASDDDDAVPSNSLVYQPNYNVYQYGGDVVYENSVVYRQADDTTILDSEQTLIKGKQISLPALIADYQRDGSTMALVDVTAGKTGVGSTESTAPTTLTVPSELSESTWQDLLADELDENGGQVTDVTDNGDTVTFTLAAAEYDITCPVVGVGTTPNNSPVRVEGQAGGINPSSAGDVRLSDIERDPANKDLIVLSFTNPGDDVNLSEARFNFYQAGSNDGPDRLDASKYDLGTQSTGTEVISDLQLRGAPQEPSPNATFTGSGDVTALALRFEDTTGSQYSPSQSGIAVLNLVFSDGQEANYFVNMPKQGTTVTNDSPTADFTFSPSSPSVGDVITFDGGPSSDPEGSSLSYEWDWESDGSYDATGETAQHTYTMADTYDVTLRVTDSDGGTDTVTKQVTVGGGVGGGADIVSGSASNLGGTNSQQQTIEFTLGDSLSNGETITVDLSDTTRGSFGGIAYSNPSTTASGSVSLNGKSLEYTASGSETVSDSISITIDANPEKNADNGGGTTYTVTFNGADSSTAQDTFTVS